MDSLTRKRDCDKKTGAEKKCMNSIILIRSLFLLTFNKAHFWHLTNVTLLFDEGGKNVLLNNILWTIFSALPGRRFLLGTR